MRRNVGLLAVLLAFVLCTPARAELVGFFPGLEALTERADAIVVLRVDRAADTSGLAFGSYATYDCYIYQTLKGDVTVNKQIRLQLANFRVAFFSLPEGSVWLAFLCKESGERKDVAGISYASLAIFGSMVQVSPLGQEKAPDGETPVEKVRSILKAAVECRQKEYEKEQAYLRMLIEGKPDTDGSKSLSR